MIDSYTHIDDGELCGLRSYRHAAIKEINSVVFSKLSKAISSLDFSVQHYTLNRQIESSS